MVDINCFSICASWLIVVTVTFCIEAPVCLAVALILEPVAPKDCPIVLKDCPIAPKEDCIFLTC